MNGRSVGGTIAALVIGAIIFFVRMGANDSKVGEFAQDTKQDFINHISTTAFYKEGDNANYIDYLATAAHEQAWENNHELVYRTRRRSDCVIDVPGYERDMLMRMMQVARDESAQHIADGLSTIYNEWFHVE